MSPLPGQISLFDYRAPDAPDTDNAPAVAEEETIQPVTVVRAAAPSASIAVAPVDLTKTAALFSFRIHKFGNRRKARIFESGLLDARQKREIDRVLSSSKTLIESPALKAINDYLEDARQWFQARGAISFTEGSIFVKLDMVSAFEDHVREVNETLQTLLIPDLLRDYPRAKSEARERFYRIARDSNLPDLYDEREYPTPDRLAACFSIDHQWLTFAVPPSLPEEIRERESAKLREKYAQAQDDIVIALRETFSAMLDHATDRLSAGADGKPKIFRDSLIENFQAFFDTFNARNIMADQELENLVQRARAIIGSADPDTLRRSPTARQIARERLTTIRADVDALLVDKPRRLIDLSEDDE